MMFGQQPQRNIFNLPTLAGQDFAPLPSIDEAGAVPAAPPEPFVFGAGGARLTPEQVNNEHERAAAMMAAGSDYSPVGHWTQGLARVGQAISGALLEKRARGDAEAIQADRAGVIAALAGGTPTAQSGAVAAALSGSDPVAQKYALQVDERLHPKPVNNDTVQDYQFRAATLGKDTADEWLRRGNDPFVTATTPMGFYAGPQSGFASAMGGGQPIPSGPTPGTVQDGYRFKGGNPAEQSNWEAVR